MPEKKQDDLLPIEFKAMNAVDIFKTETIDKIIEKVNERADEHIDDMTTAAGRAAIITNSFRATKTKTIVIAKGSEVMAESKKIIEITTAGVKRLSMAMDKLRERKRKPVVDYENAEKLRKDNHLANIEMIKEQYPLSEGKPSSEIAQIVDSVNSIPIDESFEEYQEEAQLVKDNEIANLKVRFDAALESEKNQAELEQLREANKKRAQEKEKADKINTRIEGIRIFAANTSDEFTVTDIIEKISKVKAIEIDESFGDQEEIAGAASIGTIAVLEHRLKSMKQHESDQAAIAAKEKIAADEKKEEARKQGIQDLFNQYYQRHANFCNGLTVIEWNTYITGLKEQLDSIGDFGERKEEAREYITGTITHSESMRDRQVKDDTKQDEDNEAAYKKAKAEEDEKAKKLDVQLKEKAAKEKADREAADQQLHDRKIAETISHLSISFGIDKELASKMVAEMKKNLVPNIKWV